MEKPLLHAHVRPCTWAVGLGAKRIKKIGSSENIVEEYRKVV
jgi:hypothetical protein